MLNRYSLNFDDQVWRNIRITFRKTGSTSIWYRFIKSLVTYFSGTLIDISNYVYSQIFLEHCNYASLKKAGRGYRLYPKPGETVETFRKRIQLKRRLLSLPPSTALIKSIFSIYCDCDAVITKTKLMTNVFTIGVTPIGVGKIVSSNYLRFSYSVLLPDLTGQEIDRDYIKKVIDEFNPNNEAFIYENRPLGLWQW
ncbi:MAG TPA: hypothetical protein P5295_10080 [Spirochaetota bacterium]|nr:hypothetical protein [Spirochaetota bacterium]